jgi:hypothetical protein
MEQNQHIAENGKEVIVVQTTAQPDASQRMTFVKLGHSIRVAKYYILGATALCTLIGFLAVRYAINPSRETLSTTFTYLLPLTSVTTKSEDGSTSTTNYYYLDGTEFAYSDLIGYTNLSAIISSATDENGNLLYQGLNADSLVNQKKILISKGSDAFTFTITATASAVGGSTLGTSFLTAIADSAVTKATVALDDYSIEDFLTTAYGTKDFDLDVSILGKQYTAISDSYDALTTTFSPDLSIAGTPLKTYVSNFKNRYYYTDAMTTLTQYKNLLTNNKYVRYSGEEERQSKIAQFQAQGESDKSILVADNKKYDEYATYFANFPIAAIPTNDDLATEYAKISEALRSLNEERRWLASDLVSLGYEVSDDYQTITYYTGSDTTKYGKIQHLQNPNEGSWKVGCDNFSAQLEAAKKSLLSDVASHNYVYHAAYKANQDSVTYTTPVTSAGHVSSALGAFAGLLGGFVVSVLVSYLVVDSKAKKNPETNRETQGSK